MTHVELEQFVAEYGTDIYSFCCCLTNSRQEADDLYQETFLKAVEKQKNLDLCQNPKSYLLSVAVFLWKNQKRKAGWRRKITYIRTDSLEDDRPDCELIMNNLPEDMLIRNEMITTVREAVDRLPDKMKIAVLLYYMEERSVEEIAGILHIPRGTVKSRLYQAREKLKRELEHILDE